MVLWLKDLKSLSEFGTINISVDMLYERRVPIQAVYEYMDQNEEYLEDENFRDKNEKSFFNDTIEWFEAVAVAVMVVLLVFTFVLRQVVVEGDSMLPTLSNGDRLIITHLFYTPNQGDIVVVNCEGEHKLNKTIIKRVIATEGQEVNIDFDNGVVTVDGAELKEDYINALTTRNDGAFSYPVTVPEGCIFVMGDNRNHSTDSRNPEVGFLSVDDVLGKAFFRITPFNKLGFIE